VLVVQKENMLLSELNSVGLRATGHACLTGLLIPTVEVEWDADHW
jgi:hypothetical protein